MSSIIAGRFQTFDQAEGATKALVKANVKRQDMSDIYVNPPGQHDATGGLSGAGDSDHPTPPPRQAGILVAVRVEDDERTQRAIEVLSAEGAKGVEMADGTWRDGEWKDFDPVAPPRLIHWPVGSP